MDDFPHTSEWRPMMSYRMVIEAHHKHGSSQLDGAFSAAASGGTWLCSKSSRLCLALLEVRKYERLKFLVVT